MSLDFTKVNYIDGSTIIEADNLNDIQDAILALDNNKVEAESGKGLSTEDYTSAEKAKLSGIEAGAQVNPGNATTGADGLMSSVDKAKLEGIATGATAVTIDSTLTVAGQAADAKATGDALAEKYEKPSGGIPDADIASAATWNAKGTYSKPSGGIPKTDLASTVQTSLGKADTALQSVPSTYRTATAQDVIDAGKQAKINVSGLLKGNGNGSVSAATAGTDYETPAGAKTLGITGAAVGDLVRVAAVDASGKPTSWSHVPLCDIVTNPNLLDNWYFVYGKTIHGNNPYSADNSFPINQRGQQTYTNAGYGIDRWFTISQGAVEISADGISTQAPGYNFRQKIEHPEKLAGKTVTISMLGNSEYSAIALYYDGGLIRSRLLDSTGFASTICVIPDNPTGLYCSIYARSGTANKIKAVKLELGAEQTLAHWDGTKWVLNEVPDYSEELTKCMYYYQRFSGTVSLGYGSMQTVRRASIPVMFPTIIKTPYTFTQSGNAGITYSGGNPIPTVTMNAGSSALAEMYAELPSGATDGSKGECVNLWLRSGAYFEFSAE